MKPATIIIVAALAAVLADGQWQAVPHTQDPQLETVLNAKPAVSIGTSVPAACTAGLDFYLLTTATPGTLYYCDAPNHWTSAIAAVSAVFGRAGAVTAQSGDYNTAQITESGNLYFTNARAQAAMAGMYQTPISGAPSTWPTLGTAAAYAATDFEPALGNPGTGGYCLQSTTGGTRSWGPCGSGSGGPTGPAGGSLVGTYPSPDIDFPGVAVLPPTTTGITRIVRLTTDNSLWRGDGLTWSQIAGSGMLTVMEDGTAIGTASSLNFLTEAGIVSTFSVTGSQVNVAVNLDSAVVQTPWAAQSGAVVLCASASASGTTYACGLSPTLQEYADGMVLHWVPDVNGSGGATTLNVDTLGAVPIKQWDGATNPTSSSIVAGEMYPVFYDGAAWRLPAGGGGGGGRGGKSPARSAARRT